MKDNIALGIIKVLIGGILWGISGVCGGYLFMYRGFNANLLVPFRLLSSSAIILIYLYINDRKNLFKIWRNKKDAIGILIFSIFGMLMCQYTYYKTIEYSNPSIATVLQYTGPALILIYACMSEKRIPKKYELIALIFSAIGVFILATHGNVNTLQIKLIALFWGMFSALTLAIYTIQPVRLLKKYGSTYVLAWGMLIGGIVLSFITNPIKNNTGIYDLMTFIMFFTIVIFGTVISFSLYLSGVSTIGATKASIIACIEPVSAAFFSTIFLKTPFSFLDFIGFILVISTVIIVSYFGKKHV